MAKILSIFSHKGGVGKTTISINLAAAFALMLSYRKPKEPQRVLLIDLDEQAHTSTLVSKGFFGNKDDSPPVSTDNIATLLMQNSTKTIDQIIKTSHLPLNSQGNLDYIPSNRVKMTRVEPHLRNSGSDALLRLKTILEPIRDSYEFIIIDNPPGMNYTNLNGLVTATHVLVTTQLETPSIESLNNGLRTIESIRQKYNPPLDLAGILPTMCDFRISEHRNFLEALRKLYKKKVLPPITRRADITYATSKGLDIFSHKPPRNKRNIESKNNSVIEFANLATVLRKQMRN